MIFTFNSKPPTFTPYSGNITIPTEHSMFKYADLRYVLPLCSKEISDLLLSCPFDGTYKHKLVDIKIHDLNEGECPCIFGWHLDGHPNPHHYPRPAKYHLFLIGPEESRTLFLSEPVSLEVNLDSAQNMDADYKRQLAIKKPNYFHAPEKAWTTFTSEDFHSGPIVKSNARRLLVRIAETDWISPRNRTTTEQYKEKHERN